MPSFGTRSAARSPLAPAHVKLLTARNHLLQGRSDGAVVLLLDESPPDEVDGDGGMRALTHLRRAPARRAR